jgi:hypothetical protein
MMVDVIWKKLSFEFNELEINCQIGIHDSFDETDTYVNYTIWEYQRAQQFYWVVKDLTYERMAEYSDYLFGDERDFEYIILP